MTREELFEIWSPRAGVWTPWAKAVLFAHYRSIHDAAISDAIEFPNFKLENNTAAIVDLPGARGVLCGLNLARCRYRPVPLYNAVPGRSQLPQAVDVPSILSAIVSATGELASLRIPPYAPPVFLLDANRRGTGSILAPGMFDNRSIAFPTDFPSAAFLAGEGIRQAVVIQESDSQPQPDLSRTLLSWQKAGMKISTAALDSGHVREIVVSPPSRIGRFLHGMLTSLRLRRNPMGGYGGDIPFPGSSWAAG